MLPLNSEHDYTINLIPNKSPPHLLIYNLSAKELEILREYIQKAIVKGQIRESKSPTSALILFIPKADGSLRLYVNYRALNNIIIKDRHPLPLISKIMDRFIKAKRFTKLDITNAYHRLRIKEGDEQKTTFRTRYGHYEYLVMPFRLTNALATFQRYIYRALAGLLDNIYVVYLDNILIFSKTEEEHVKHVKLILQRLIDQKLYVKLSKCEFYITEVNFLGFRVGVNSVSIELDRIKAVEEQEALSSFRNIQVFLGFTNFYRRFVYAYSDKVKGMLQLLSRYHKNRKALQDQTDDAALSFQLLKDAFTSNQVLRHFDPNLLIKVITNALLFTYGGILLQLMQAEGANLNRKAHQQPVAFYSKKFTNIQVRYDTYDRELMAIQACLNHQRHYYAGAAYPVRVVIDHNNLRWFMSTKKLNSR